MINLKGCGTALVTPFRADGEVDYDAFAALVQRQVESGVDFLLPLGTTGETPCLSVEERIRILEITREYSCGRPVIVGGGTNSLVETVSSIKSLEPYGPDAFLVVVPYYNKPTQEGMYRYFKAVAQSTEKPVILYNVPGRTGVNMQPQTVLRLANEVENIVAIKEASGNFEQVKTIIDGAPEGFQVLSGDDDMTCTLMKAGADGVFSVASNIAPKEVADMTHFLLEGRIGEAEAVDAKLQPLFKACFIESNPIPAKTMLWLKGCCENEFRLPMCPAMPQTVDYLKEILKNY